MIYRFVFYSHLNKSRWLFCFLLILIFGVAPEFSRAHQSPTTIILIDVSPARVAMELQLPLSELELSFGYDVFKNPDNLVERVGPQLKEYIMAHIHAFIEKDNPWMIDVTEMKVEKAQQMASGPPFREITVHLILTPPAGVSTRKFTLDYDVIMHQVVTHAAFISIRNDWELGITGDEQPAEVGVIRVDTRDNKIYPLEINLEKGSWWKGFKSMVVLGMHHIAEGTDHLLFLLALLLPATLLVNDDRWGKYGGLRYSLLRLLKIVTAFTIGHSFTLLIGTLGWVRLPTQLVEILIAFSILISAGHAIRPIFPGRETYIAAGFGLIHGLAFAGVIANLHLAATPMVLSILGFNLGIEMMQLFVIAIIIPWLIILSRTKVYSYVRVPGAVFASVAAIAWMVERYFQKSNPISELVTKIAAYAPWIIFGLAMFALSSFFWNKKTSYNLRKA